MKIVLITSGGKNLGLEYIGAFLESKGHSVNYVFDPTMIYASSARVLGNLGDFSSKIVDKIISLEPDLIGFSVISDAYGWACRVAEQIKERLAVPVVFGGIHPTSVPEVVILEKNVDYVCVGEGEEAMAELAMRLAKKENTFLIKNIWAKKDGEIFKNSPRALIRNLDSLPFPGDIFFYQGYGKLTTLYALITSRGCLHGCSYCYNNVLRRIYKHEQEFVRRRSVDNVIKELENALARDKNIKHIAFLDNIFTYDLAWLKEFAEKYKQKIGLPFMCDATPSYVSDEVVNLLESAGCATVQLGLQTLSEVLSKDVLSRNQNRQQIISAIELFKASRICLIVHIIFNIPGQDEKELSDMARFFSRYSPDKISVFPLRYYPRTDIIEQAEQAGILNKENIKRIENSQDYISFGLGTSFSNPQEVLNSQIKGHKKMVNLILISRLFPPFLMEFILKLKLYQKIMPLLNTIYFCCYLWVFYYKIFFKHKRRFKSFPLRDRIRFFLWKRKQAFSHVKME